MPEKSFHIGLDVLDGLADCLNPLRVFIANLEDRHPRNNPSGLITSWIGNFTDRPSRPTVFNANCIAKVEFISQFRAELAEIRTDL